MAVVHERSNPQQPVWLALNVSTGSLLWSRRAHAAAVDDPATLADLQAADRVLTWRRPADTRVDVDGRRTLLVSEYGVEQRDLWSGRLVARFVWTPGHNATLLLVRGTWRYLEIAPSSTLSSLALSVSLSGGDSDHSQLQLQLRMGDDATTAMAATAARQQQRRHTVQHLHKLTHDHPIPTSAFTALATAGPAIDPTTDSRVLYLTCNGDVVALGWGFCFLFFVFCFFGTKNYFHSCLCEDRSVDWSRACICGTK
jgi:hypothetical protein